MSEESELEKRVTAVVAIGMLDGPHKAERLRRSVDRLVEVVMAESREGQRAELDAVRAERDEARRTERERAFVDVARACDMNALVDAFALRGDDEWLPMIAGTVRQIRENGADLAVIAIDAAAAACKTALGYPLTDERPVLVLISEAMARAERAEAGVAALREVLGAILADHESWTIASLHRAGTAALADTAQAAADAAPLDTPLDTSE